MKVVTGSELTCIYPFVKPDSEVVGFREQIVVSPDGTMRLLWDSKVRLDLEAARTLIQALLRAVEEAEKGQK